LQISRKAFTGSRHELEDGNTDFIVTCSGGESLIPSPPQEPRMMNLHPVPSRPSTALSGDLFAHPALGSGEPPRPLAPLPVTALTAHEHIGFELGWDYAHYGLQPPSSYAQEPSPLRHGLLAGQAAFGERCLPATRAVRKWLQLRLHAWLRGRSVELLQITPSYLEQIDVLHCPVTRVALSNSTLQDSDASIDRLRNDAGYAAGNLAMMSTRANQAKGALGFEAAMRVVRQIEDRPVLDIAGLGAAAWKRMAILCSFVEPLAHADACTLPLLVLPPRRVHLLNPVQALQAALSLQLMRPGWAERSRQFDALLQGKPLRRAFQTFFHTLLPRVLEAVSPTQRQARTEQDQLSLRWAIEDAWRNPLVLRRWTEFARQLDAAGCEALLQRMAAHKLVAQRIATLSDEQATEGWSIDTRGYVPHAVLMRRRPTDIAARVTEH
jgi:hypothetical protein